MALSTRLLKAWGKACQERNLHFCNVAFGVLHMITTTIAIASAVVIDKALVHIEISRSYSFESRQREACSY